MDKFEELTMREYLIYAFGSTHARNFDLYKKEFIEIFLSQPERSKREDNIPEIPES